MNVEPQLTTPASPVLDPSRAVDAMLAEYQTLRQESLESISHRMTIVNFTFAILGVVIGGLLTRTVSDLLAGLIAVLFVPQIAKAALLMWLGEYERSRRAGKWLCELEERINDGVGAKAVGWESRLWKGSSATGDDTAAHMDYPYVAVIVLLLGAGYTAIALGTYLLFVHLERTWGVGGAVAISTAIAVASAVFELLFFWYFRAKWATCRSRN
jgi:hypothetical protein